VLQGHDLAGEIVTVSVQVGLNGSQPQHIISLNAANAIANSLFQGHDLAGEIVNVSVHVDLNDSQPHGILSLNALNAFFKVSENAW
jgi:hypothetical protein